MTTPTRRPTPELSAAIVKYYRAMVGSAFRITRDHDKAEEAAQEAISTILRWPPSDTTTDMRSWLSRAACNTAKTLYRKGERYVGGVEVAMAGLSVQPGQEAATDVASLLAASAALPEQERQVFGLIAGGLSLSEAGVVMGISKQRAGFVMQSARRALLEAA